MAGFDRSSSGTVIALGWEVFVEPMAVLGSR